jgi:hypothetical protein
MTQSGLLHSQLSMASQAYAQTLEGPNLNRRSPPYVQSLQYDNSTSPTLSSDLPHYHAEASDADLTPPTSSSGLSTQDNPILVGHDNSIPSQSVRTDSLHAPTLGSAVGSPNGAGGSLESNAATKRTSSGQIKRSSTTSGDASKQGQNRRPAHTRASSVLSNGTSVTEVSLLS